MRKTFLVLVLALCALSTVFASGEAETATTAKEAGKKYTIAFSLKTTTNDDFQKAIADSVEKPPRPQAMTFCW